MKYFQSKSLQPSARAGVCSLAGMLWGMLTWENVKTPNHRQSTLSLRAWHWHCRWDRRKEGLSGVRRRKSCHPDEAHRTL